MTKYIIIKTMLLKSTWLPAFSSFRRTSASPSDRKWGWRPPERPPEVLCPDRRWGWLQPCAESRSPKERWNFWSFCHPSKRERVQMAAGQMITAWGCMLVTIDKIVTSSSHNSGPRCGSFLFQPLMPHLIYFITGGREFKSLSLSIFPQSLSILSAFLYELQSYRASFYFKYTIWLCGCAA